MPQEITLPDGRILVIPDSTTLDQRAALRNKLGSQYADIKTGSGMEQRAVQQSKGELASRVKSTGPGTLTNDVQEEGYRRAYGAENKPGKFVMSDMDVATAGLGGMGIGKGIATRGAKAMVRPVARTVLGAAGGSALGGYGGREIGGMFGDKGRETGGQIGATVGGLAGGYAGARGMKVPSGRMGLLESVMGTPEAEPIAKPPSVVGTSTATPVGNATLPPVPATPEPPMTLGARTAAARTAPASTSGVTRVPVPRSPLPGDPNLMGSVPRPELPEMAGRGVPGAADQQRLLGEPVIYTPPEGYPQPRSVTNLSERIPQPESPSLSQRTTMAPEDDLEMARRGASGRETIDEEVARREQESAQSAESQRQQWEQQQGQGQGQPPQSNLLAQRTARARASAIRAARPRQGQQP